MAKILLIEDDKSLCKVVSEWLKDEDHIVEVAEDGATGLDYLKFYSYDVAVIDWDLPKMKGPDICRTFRSRGGQTPILMLTGKSDIADKEQGLDSGADDYLTKPFHPRELSARLRAMLRRPPVRLEQMLRVQDIELDTVTHAVRRAGKEIHLMPKEFALLEFLMKHPDQTFNADAILNRLWPSDSEVSTELIKVYIAKLRKKIEVEGSPAVIATVHGVGYKIKG